MPMYFGIYLRFSEFYTPTKMGWKTTKFLSSTYNLGLVEKSVWIYRKICNSFEIYVAWNLCAWVSLLFIINIFVVYIYLEHEVIHLCQGIHYKLFIISNNINVKKLIPFNMFIVTCSFLNKNANISFIFCITWIRILLVT